MSDAYTISALDEARRIVGDCTARDGTIDAASLIREIAKVVLMMHRAQGRTVAFREVGHAQSPCCVIQQGDLYWRSNRCGYTRNLIDAGIYPEADARRIEAGGRTPRDRAIRITPTMVAELQEELDAHATALQRFRLALPCPSCGRYPSDGFHLCQAAEAPFTGLDDGPALEANRG